MVDNNYKGFSLVEVVLILGLFGIIAVIFIPFSIRQLTFSKLESSSKQMSSSIYLFQQYGASRKNDSSHGVAFNYGSYTLFEGDSLSTASYTEIYDLPSGTNINSINLTNSANEIVFEKGEFKPDEYGYVRVSDGSDSYRIVINKEGLIDIYAE